MTDIEKTPIAIVRVSLSSVFREGDSSNRSALPLSYQEAATRMLI